MPSVTTSAGKIALCWSENEQTLRGHNKKHTVGQLLGMEPEEGCRGHPDMVGGI